MRAVVMMFALALFTSWTEGRRVKLNSIRTIILRETHAMPVNRSARTVTGDVFAKLYQCISDLECSEGSYCHAPSKSLLYSRCKPCRRRKRRCHRDGMCCPGNRCSNNLCVADVDSFPTQWIPDAEDGAAIPSTEKRRPRMKVGMGTKGQVGDPCLRSSDCSEGLCCARHFWNRICKPVLQEGQVCTRHRRKGLQGLEIFQRCHCGEGLGCRALQRRAGDGDGGPPWRPSPWTPPSSAASRHASPHTSLLSVSSSPSSSAAKARLHVCQRN